MTFRDWFTSKRIWAGLVFFALAFEVRGLLRKQGGTLSEYTWSKTHTPAMRGLVVGLVGWLLFHFSFGTSNLGVLDAVFAGGGVVLGVMSAVLRRKS